jgi:hypothetical protein
MILVIKSIIMENDTCRRVQCFLVANELLDTNRYTAEMI